MTSNIAYSAELCNLVNTGTERDRIQVRRTLAQITADETISQMQPISGRELVTKLGDKEAYVIDRPASLLRRVIDYITGNSKRQEVTVATIPYLPKRI